MRSAAWRFRKYGQKLEEEDLNGSEPESPYESAPYVPPEKRPLSEEEKEKRDLAELRGGATNHWDT